MVTESSEFMSEDITSIQNESTQKVGIIDQDDLENSALMDCGKQNIRVSDQEPLEKIDPANNDVFEQKDNDIESIDVRDGDGVEEGEGGDGLVDGDRIEGGTDDDGFSDGFDEEDNDGFSDGDDEEDNDGFSDGDDDSEEEIRENDDMSPDDGVDDVGIKEGDNSVDPGSDCKEAATARMETKILQSSRPAKKKFKFNSTHCVNHNLTLRDLKLDGFSGCYKMDNVQHMLFTLTNICKTVKIPLEFVLHDDNAEGSTANAGLYQCHVSLHMNNVRVCDGYGDHNSLARRDAVQTAHNYLQHKGLLLWNPATIRAENRRYVSWGEVKVLGHDKKGFKKNLAEFLQEFLEDPDLVELRMSGVVKSGRRKWKAKSLNAVGRNLNLRVKADFPKRLFHMYKVNSVIHNLRVFPATEQPMETEEDEQSDDQEVRVDNPGPAKRRIFKPTEKFNPNLTNNHLMGIKYLKLDKYHGVLLRSDDHVNIIMEMTKSAKVPCEIRVEGPLTPFLGKQYIPHIRWRANLYINNTFIAKGCGRTEVEAKTGCAKNSLFFLMSKGLHVIYEDKICSEQIKKVQREDLHFLSVEGHFSNFLAERKFLKMKFCFTATDAEKGLIETSCNTHSLVQRSEETGEIVALKLNNSSVHEIEVVIPESFVPTSSKTIDITEEDLLNNSSIRHSVEKFVKNNYILKLQLPNSLGTTERELAEALSEKYKLTYFVDDAGKVYLSKGSDRCVADRKQTPNSFPQPKTGLTKKEKREIRKKGKFAERYGPYGRRGKKRPSQSAGRRGKKRKSQSAGPTITKTIKADSVGQRQLLMSHFVPAMDKNDNRPTLPNPSLQSAILNQTHDVQTASRRMLQNHSTYDRIKNPGYQNQTSNWQNPGIDYSQNSYRHSSQQPNYQCSEYGSSPCYGTYNSSFPASSQTSQTSHNNSQYQPNSGNFAGGVRGKHRASKTNQRGRGYGRF